MIFIIEINPYIIKLSLILTASKLIYDEVKSYLINLSAHIITTNFV